MLATRNVGRKSVYMNVDGDEIYRTMKGFDTDQTSLFGEKKQTRSKTWV